MTETDDAGSQWRVGIDTGGTFADIVARPPGGAGAVRIAKVSRFAGHERLAETLRELGVSGPALVVHGTTHVTNSILEGAFASTALVTTRGFGDVLRIARQSRDSLYDLDHPARLAPIVPPERTFELAERCAADGSVLEALDEEALVQLTRKLVDRHVEAVAVCLLNSYANPEHEQRVGAAIGEIAAVSLSNQVSPEAREYERAAATTLNAAVLLSTRSYLGQLASAISAVLPQARLYVVNSAGGMMPTAAASNLPLATVMSGPAAGAAAVSRLARQSGVARALACDVGGTSTDVSLIIDGTPATARDRQVGGRVVRIPAIAVESIAIGGGSIIGLDDVNALTVGPRSAAAVPGPACYGRGGLEPTITDAALVCGVIGSGGEVPELHLNRELAEGALARVAGPMSLDVEDLAWRAIDVAQGEIAHAVSVVASRRGYDLRDCTLVAYGGGGPIHAGPLAARTGIRRVIIPLLAPVFSALGCCLADIAVEAARTHRCSLTDENLSALETVAGEMVASETSRIDERADRITVKRWLELRYLGQNSELAIPWSGDADASALSRAFHAAHQREYGFDSRDLVEATAVRCRIEVARELAWPPMEPGHAGAATTAHVTFSGGTRLEVPVTGLGDLARRGVRHGPALIAVQFGSITVCEGQKASLDKYQNVILEQL